VRKNHSDRHVVGAKKPGRWLVASAANDCGTWQAADYLSWRFPEMANLPDRISRASRRRRLLGFRSARAFEPCDDCGAYVIIVVSNDASDTRNVLPRNCRMLRFLSIQA